MNSPEPGRDSSRDAAISPPGRKIQLSRKHLLRLIMENDPDSWRGYEWTALSVTTVGALLASIQGSALLIALPDIMAQRLIDLDRRIGQLEKAAQGDIPPTAQQVAARQRKH